MSNLPLTLADGKPLVHSYTSLKEFGGDTGCPMQFYRTRIIKDIKKIWKTSQQKQGTTVHNALEQASKFGEPNLPAKFAQYDWLLAKRFKTRAWLEQQTGQRPIEYYEKQLAWRRDLSPSSFWDADSHYRGALDYLAVAGDMAVISDTKTGNPNYPDANQLLQQSLLVFTAMPQVNKILGDLDYTRAPGKPFRQVVYRDDSYANPVVPDYSIMSEIMDDVQLTISRIERLVTAGDPTGWFANQNNFCRSCPLTRDDCAHKP